MKHNEYAVMKANGEIERFRVPTIFDAFDVAKRLAHSMVFLKVPKGSTIGTKNAGFVEGPVLVLVDPETEDIYLIGSRDIKAEHDAFDAWKTVRSEGYAIA